MKTLIVIVLIAFSSLAYSQSEGKELYRKAQSSDDPTDVFFKCQKLIKYYPESAYADSARILLLKEFPLTSYYDFKLFLKKYHNEDSTINEEVIDFTYSYFLQDPSLHQGSLEEMLANYPESQFADSAQYCLQAIDVK